MAKVYLTKIGRSRYLQSKIGLTNQVFRGANYVSQVFGLDSRLRSEFRYSDPKFGLI